MNPVKPKVIILDDATLNPGDLSWDQLKKYADIEIYQRTSTDQIISRSLRADALITNKVVLNKDVINQLPKLRYIGVAATGYNVVDIKAAYEKQITVTNIPAYATMSVAQMVFAHILEFTNNVALHSASVKQGDWAKSADFSYVKKPLIELDGLTLGIIGYGNSGKATAKIAQSFGMKVMIYARKKENLQGFDLHKMEEKTTNSQGFAVENTTRKKNKASFCVSYKGENIVQTDLKTLFTKSDFITLHCPLNEDSKEIINAKNLSLMKETAYLINTGRGGLVNEDDLANALKNNKIAGAALDVLSVEPPKNNNPLIDITNCNITPHISWATFAARKRAIAIIINNFISYLSGNPINEV